jgi:hypothetical protein
MASASRVYLKPQQKPIFCNGLQARVGRFRPSPPVPRPRDCHDDLSHRSPTKAEVPSAERRRAHPEVPFARADASYGSVGRALSVLGLVEFACCRESTTSVLLRALQASGIAKTTCIR